MKSNDSENADEMEIRETFDSFKTMEKGLELANMVIQKISSEYPVKSNAETIDGAMDIALSALAIQYNDEKKIVDKTRSKIHAMQKKAFCLMR